MTIKPAIFVSFRQRLSWHFFETEWLFIWLKWNWQKTKSKRNYNFAGSDLPHVLISFNSIFYLVLFKSELWNQKSITVLLTRNSVFGRDMFEIITTNPTISWTISRKTTALFFRRQLWNRLLLRTILVCLYSHLIGTL